MKLVVKRYVANTLEEVNEKVTKLNEFMGDAKADIIGITPMMDVEGVITYMRLYWAYE